MAFDKGQTMVAQNQVSQLAWTSRSGEVFEVEKQEKKERRKKRNSTHNAHISAPDA
jgi:hypothetical protein